jgi:hypothetical protein
MHVATVADSPAASTCSALVARPDLVLIAFGSLGQSLNDQFELYREKISSMTTGMSGLLGIAIAGDDATVRQATKKFSLYE